VQTARTAEGPRAGRSVAAGIVSEVRSRNTGEGLGSIGVVVGATVRLEDYGLTRDELVGLPVLAPGFGHQGARFADLPALYGPAATSTLVSVSRSVLSAGPDGIGAALESSAKEVAECLA
jgi:orotidine-5'-phosphate decarboxylase